ncbi:MAG: aminotransferase class V-fold PLP-dependent enzyme [Clostridia bacterium]|nr:aminotransferase class V-fold PLP-dependent enzyme [Clostridia bacterium]
MNTPICDFVRAYAKKRPARLHMPGHKGKGTLGVEARDITEITGADVLYHGTGIIAESQKNATRLFGSHKTLYSTEGSSLSIRAMLLLLKQYAAREERKPVILAARNAHKSFMNAAGLLDLPVHWLSSQKELLSSTLSLDEWERAIKEVAPLALYITSPDYLGNMADVGTLADLCHRYGCLLCVDNAHGAYLKFLFRSLHPLDLGADLVVDSAHKTLPVLTGGGYFHIANVAPDFFAENAERALAFFATTSPSYLILQSLDMANAYLEEKGRADVAKAVALAKECKERLTLGGYTVLQGEPCKITLYAKDYGYTGEMLAKALEKKGVYAEFADREYLVLMLSPSTQKRDMARAMAALLSLPKRAPIEEKPPCASLKSPELSLAAAMLAKTERVPITAAAGRILASATVSCPPAVPIALCGERLSEEAVALCLYYGIEEVSVVEEKK